MKRPNARKTPAVMRRIDAFERQTRYAAEHAPFCASPYDMYLKGMVTAA